MSDKILGTGLIIAMLALWIWNWAHMRILLRHERQILELRKRSPEEQRCGFCLNYPKCLARNTGVLYPCPHIRLEDDDGNEE